MKSNSRVSSIDRGRFHNQRGWLLLIFFGLTIWLNITFLKPLIMGAIFASVLYPVMGRLHRWRAGDGVKAALITIGFLFAFLVPVGLFVALAADKAIDQSETLQKMNLNGSPTVQARTIENALGLGPLMDKISDLSPVSEAQFQQFTNRAVTSTATFLGHAVQDMIAGIPGILFSNIIILFTIFFLLLDGRRAVAFIRDNSIFGLKQTDRFLATAQGLCHSVLIANVFAGSIQSLLLGAACLITGNGGAILVMFATFLASFFPVVGVAPVTIFLTAHAFLQGRNTAGFVFLACVFIVPIVENVAKPYVLTERAKLHPLVAFVAAFGAFDVIGFYGLFIGPVVAGLFFALLPMVTQTYQKSGRV